MLKNIIVIIIKCPTNNRVKTRISVNMGWTFTNLFFLASTKDLIDNLKSEGNNFQVAFYTDSTKDRHWFRKNYFVETFNFPKRLQSTNFGSKIEYIFQSLFKKGYENVIVQPMDIPFFTSQNYFYIFQQFQKKKYIVGFNRSGSLSYIGINRSSALKGKFNKIIWGTERTALDIINSFGINKSIGIKTFEDLDTTTDIQRNARLIRYFCPRLSSLCRNYELI